MRSSIVVRMRGKNDVQQSNTKLWKSIQTFIIYYCLFDCVLLLFQKFTKRIVK